ncbi:hypothetical protein G7Y79_00006g019670 [Physcia stellaris]|nr:hypothetical protein G7Y79_00006g019670 [Physcia stellaris]
MAQKLATTSRTGRDNQRYGAQGERLVAGVVPLSADKTKVLLIQSTRRGGWVLPKGGWETDEAIQEAACREAWEEAGIECTVTKDLGKIQDRRAPNELTPHAPRAVFQFFEVSVQKEASEWPEKHKRGRQWMAYQAAKQALAPRPELAEALDRSSITR